MRRRLISALLALGLLMSLVAGALSVSAQGNIDTLHYNAIFFPWVPYGDTIDGTGPHYGAVVIQNVDEVDIKVFFLPYISLLEDIDPNNPPFNIDLKPRASQTVHAQTFPFLAAPGSSVVAVAVNLADWKAFTNGGLETASPAPIIAGVQKQVAAEPFNVGVNTGGNHITVDGYNGIPFADVAWGPLSDFCFNLNFGQMCDGTGLYIAGFGIGGFDGHSYLPIAQTNSDWNSVIYVSNTDDSGATVSQVQVQLITTDQQGFGAGFQDKYWLENSIGPGQTWVIDVELVTGAGWVGSAWITSEVGVTTIVYRSKASTNMLMVNEAAPSLFATTGGSGGGGGVQLEAVGPTEYEQYAPLVFKAYNGWNSGFSIANISEMTNTVTMTFYNGNGTVVGGDMRTISPGGQEFIYIPHYQDSELGPGFVGSAVFTSILPFHVAVDQVKYTTGEAMSYLATAAGTGKKWPGLNNAFLLMPLVQKGNQTTGLGDTSGLQLFNAAHHEAHLAVWFYGGSGQLIEPTKFGPYPITLGNLANATIYTMTFGEMPTGLRGSAVIEHVGGKGNVVGVSNVVNYEVMGDGAVAYNMVNSRGQYRFPVAIADGAYIDLVHFEDVSDPAENNVTEFHTVIATVTNILHQPVQGATVNFSITGENPNPAAHWTHEPGQDPQDGTPGNVGTTDANGQVLYTYRGVYDGEDVITGTLPITNKSDTVLKIWHPLSLDLQPDEDENPFYGEATLAVLYALIIEDLEIQDFDDFGDILDFLNGLADLKLDTIRDGLEDEELDEADIDAIIAALIGSGLNIHELTATIKDKDDNDYDVAGLTAADYDVDISTGDVEILEVDVDPVTGVATIRYISYDGEQNLIDVELDIDGVILNSNQAIKDWEEVGLESQTRNPTVSATNEGSGTEWTSLSGITGNNEVSDAGASTIPTGSTSQILKTSTFGFTLPTDAVVLGIEARVRRAANGTGVQDQLIQLYKAGTLVGSNQADTATDWPVGVHAYASYSAIGDLWGTTWTPAEINAAGFGLGVQAQNNSGSNRNVRLSIVEITVHYLAPAP